MCLEFELLKEDTLDSLTGFAVFYMPFPTGFTALTLGKGSELTLAP